MIKNKVICVDILKISIGISIFLLSILSFLLSYLLLKKRKISISYLFWGIGVALVGFTVLQESIIYFNYWSELFIQLYVFLIAILVGILSIGSVLMLKSSKIKYIWIGYITIVGIITLLYSFTLPIPKSIIVNGIIINNVVLPTPDVIASSLLTIPAAFALIILALSSFFKTKNYSTLLIAFGVIIITIAGTLYIINFPVLLYYAEFIGILILFFGFMGIFKRKPLTNKKIYRKKN